MKLLSYIVLGVLLAVYGSGFAVSPALASPALTQTCEVVLLSDTTTLVRFTSSAGNNATATLIANPDNIEVMIRETNTGDGTIFPYTNAVINLSAGVAYEAVANAESLANTIQINYCYNDIISSPTPTPPTPTIAIPTVTPTASTTPVVVSSTPTPTVSGSSTTNCVESKSYVSGMLHHSWYGNFNVIYALWPSGYAVDAYQEDNARGDIFSFTPSGNPVFLLVSPGTYILYNQSQHNAGVFPGWGGYTLAPGASEQWIVDSSTYLHVENPTNSPDFNFKICALSRTKWDDSTVGTGTITDTNNLQMTQVAQIGGIQNAQMTTNALLATSNAIENIPESTLVPLQQTANALAAQQATALANGLTVSSTVNLSASLSLSATVNMSETNDLLRTSVALQATGQAVLTPLPYGTAIGLSEAYGTSVSLVCTREPCRSATAAYDGIAGMISDLSGVSAPSCSGFVTESTTMFSAAQMSNGVCMFVENTQRWRDLSRGASVVFAGLALVGYFIVVIRRMGDV